MWDIFHQPWRTKNVVATILFGAIILVFALFGVSPDRYGQNASGGAAAIVNNKTISINAFRERLEMVQRQQKFHMDQFPQAQREMIEKEMRRRTLEDMIAREIVFQAAAHQGITAPDAEVRDFLLNVPIFQQDGKFMRERYDQFLTQIGQTPDDFERTIRQEIVSRKLQEVFTAALMPANVELDQISALKSKSASIRYLDITAAKLGSEKAVTNLELSEYLKDPKSGAAIKKYYDDHSLDYKMNEKVKARHILLLVDDKHPDKEVAEKAKALKAKLTKENFSAIAAKESQDPSSAKKGGDLGFFEKGRMVPSFDAKAFGLKPGEISDPVKSEFGYHIILVDEHQPERTVGLDEAKPAIAKKLIAQTRVPELLEAVKKAVSSTSAGTVDAVVKPLGISWEKIDSVDLASGEIAKLGDSADILQALAKRVGRTGLVPTLFDSGDHHYVVDVTAWKDVAPEAKVAVAPKVKGKSTPAPEAKTSPRDDLRNELSYQKFGGAFDSWFKAVESKATVTRNAQLSAM